MNSNGIMQSGKMLGIKAIFATKNTWRILMQSLVKQMDGSQSFCLYAL